MYYLPTILMCAIPGRGGNVSTHSSFKVNLCCGFFLFLFFCLSLVLAVTIFRIEKRMGNRNCLINCQQSVFIAATQSGSIFFLWQWIRANVADPTRNIYILFLLFSSILIYVESAVTSSALGWCERLYIKAHGNR